MLELQEGGLGLCISEHDPDLEGGVRSAKVVSKLLGLLPQCNTHANILSRHRVLAQVVSLLAHASGHRADLPLIPEPLQCGRPKN